MISDIKKLVTNINQISKKYFYKFYINIRGYKMKITAVNSFNNCYRNNSNNAPKNKINFGHGIGVYAGSFDPITNGHFDIIRKGAELFDSLIVLIAKNPEKNNFLSPNKRLKLINESIALEGFNNVKADTFEGYTVEYAKTHNAQYLLRGMRSSKDFDYELNIARINKELAPDIETVTLFATDINNNVSSTKVREEFYRGSTNFTKMVPEPVSDYLVRLLMGAK